MAAGQNVPAGDKPLSVKSGRLLFQTSVEALSTATDATFYIPLMYAPCDGAVKSVVVIPRTKISGADTNTRKFTLLDRGAAGAGTDVVGTALSLTSGNDIEAERPYTLYDYDEDEIGDSDEDTLDAGDVLSLKQEKVGNGQTIPAMTIIVEFEARG